MPRFTGTFEIVKRIERLLSLLHLGIAADEPYVLGFISEINALETREDAEELILENQKKNQAFFYHIDEQGHSTIGPVDESIEEIPHNTVMVLQLRGPVMPEGYYGIPGLSDLSEMLQYAEREERIAGVVMILETGGGSIYRLTEFSDLIAQVRETKPVTMLADGMCASAGIHIGVTGNNFFATHRSARMGSIGTMIAYMDVIAFLEEQGCKYHMVVAKTSPDKNKDFRELRKGYYDNLENSLSEDHAEFKALIKAHRGEVPDEAMTGKMYNGAQALERNLIDGYATLEQAVSHTLSLSISQLTPQIT